MRGLSLAHGESADAARHARVVGPSLPTRETMIVSFTHAGVWWLVQVAQRTDTLMVRQVAQQRGWFETVTAVASGLMTVALLVLAIALVPAAWNFRKSYAKVSDLLDKVYGDINPLMRHASAIADNVNYITTSVRTDVQQVNATIAAANQRLQQAMALTEQRLGEFNALLEVVQEEAETMFIATASTVRSARRIRSGCVARTRLPLAGLSFSQVPSAPSAQALALSPRTTSSTPRRSCWIFGS